MIRIALQVVLLVVMACPGFAQDWIVTRVRGTAEQQIGGRWVELVRGVNVLDKQVVRTGADGRVGLARGAETIDLDPGTSLRLHEGAGKMTSVEQFSGVINVDVERRNVQHFSVQTPFLAAVVKGTKFRVAVGPRSSTVEVDRGTVQVQDSINDLMVDVKKGQQAEVSQANPLLVSGAGAIAVFTFDGQRVVNGTANTPADNTGKPTNAASPTISGSAGPKSISIIGTADVNTNSSSTDGSSSPGHSDNMASVGSAADNSDSSRNDRKTDGRSDSDSSYSNEHESSGDNDSRVSGNNGVADANLNQGSSGTNGNGGTKADADLEIGTGINVGVIGNSGVGASVGVGGNNDHDHDEHGNNGNGGINVGVNLGNGLGVNVGAGGGGINVGLGLGVGLGINLGLGRD